MKKLFLLPFLLMFGATLGFTNEGSGASEEDEKDETVGHVVSKEDVDANPELAEEGIKEGDTIGIPADATPAGDQDAD